VKGVIKVKLRYRKEERQKKENMAERKKRDEDSLSKSQHVVANKTNVLISEAVCTAVERKCVLCGSQSDIKLTYLHFNIIGHVSSSCHFL
jgi:hypothetical protein